MNLTLKKVLCILQLHLKIVILFLKYFILISVGEKVLCFYVDLLYEGKILKAKVNQEQNIYLIHYSGWTRRFDLTVIYNKYY